MGPCLPTIPSKFIIQFEKLPVPVGTFGVAVSVVPEYEITVAVKKTVGVASTSIFCPVVYANPELTTNETVRGRLSTV